MTANCWFVRVRPRCVRYNTLAVLAGFVLGMIILLRGRSSFDTLDDNECLITEFVEPPPGEQHRNCFLQKYCFRYNLQPKNICRQPVQLFVFIFSRPGNSHYRQLIRNTWLNRSLFDADRVQHVFLLANDGKSNGTNLKLEAEANNDIVLIDMRDSFCHLTVKGLAGLKLAGDICSNAGFVMKTDDDVFINMFMLQMKLQSLRVQQRWKERVIMCHVWYEAPVARTGQYAVSKLQYAQSIYPPFCSGMAYIMSMDVAKLLLKLAMEDQSKVLLHLDDPYITGVLANRMKLVHTHLGKLFDWDKHNIDYLSDSYLRNHLVFQLHDRHYTEDVQHSYELHVEFWRRLVKLNTEFGMPMPI